MDDDRHEAHQRVRGRGQRAVLLIFLFLGVVLIADSVVTVAVHDLNLARIAGVAIPITLIAVFILILAIARLLSVRLFGKRD